MFLGSSMTLSVSVSLECGVCCQTMKGGNADAIEAALFGYSTANVCPACKRQHMGSGVPDDYAARVVAFLGRRQETVEEYLARGGAITRVRVGVR